MVDHLLCVTGMLSALSVKWKKSVPSCLLFAAKNFQDDLCSLWTPPLLKERQAEATGEQDGGDFSGLGSGAMFLGREHCCWLPLERPNIPKEKHSADVNRGGQVSCLLQPTDSIHGNLKTQVPSQVASENIPYLCFILQVLVFFPFFFFWDQYPPALWNSCMVLLGCLRYISVKVQPQHYFAYMCVWVCVCTIYIWNEGPH